MKNNKFKTLYIISFCLTLAANLLFAAPQVTPSSHNFDRVDVGGSATQAFSINADQDLTVSDISIIGDVNNQFQIVSPPTLPLSLDEDETKNVIIKFNPNSRGSVTAKLFVGSSSGNREADLSGTGISAQTEIKRNNVVLSSNGGRESLGSSTVGDESGPVTFTITNIGNKPLSISSIDKNGTHETDFTLGGFSSGNIGGGEHKDFTVVFKPSGSGERTAEVIIQTPGSVTGDSFVLRLKGTGTRPEIEVFSGNENLTDDDNSPQDFGSINLGSSSEPQTFTIENLGEGLLKNLTIVKSGKDPSRFTITKAANFGDAIAKDNSTSFTVQYTPGDIQEETATLTIGSNDLDENEFEINVKGKGTNPELQVKDGDSIIERNVSIPFGDTTVGAYLSKTFTIKNNGTTDLRGSGSSSAVTVVKTGGDTDSFEILALSPTGVIGPNDSASFAIRFVPTTEGTFQTNISFTSNDSSNVDFQFTITGSAKATPPGGTDLFGYTSIQNIPLTVDILREGAADVTKAALSGDDKAQAVNIGFPFVFYENSYTAAGVSTNGLITFDGTSSSYRPLQIPGASTAPIKNFIAPFWSDLVAGSGSKILYTTRGEAPGRVFILKFENFQQYGHSNNKISFQVMLYEGTNAIEFHYLSKDSFANGTNLSVGIQSSRGGEGLPYWYGNQDGTSTTDRPLNEVLKTGSAIRFERPVIVTVESTYIGKPNDGTRVRCKSTKGLKHGNTVTGENIASGTTVAMIIDSENFMLSQPALGKVDQKRLTVTGSNVLISELLDCSIDVDPTAKMVSSIGVGPNVESSGQPVIDLGFKPAAGKAYGHEHGSVKRFEAPEFIYLNRNFEPLAEMGTLNASEDEIAYYRLVNDGYSVDGDIVQGTTLFFTTTVDKDITVIWRWKLEYAAIIEAVGLDGEKLINKEGLGNPEPALGRHWVEKNFDFKATIGRASGTDSLGLDVEGVRHTARDYKLEQGNSFGLREVSLPIPLATSGDRVSTAPVTATDWFKITWTLASQVRYRFGASGVDRSEGNSNFNGQSFIQYLDQSGIEIDQEKREIGMNPLNEVWIDYGQKIRVGAFYRTSDRCFTLDDFPQEPSGDMGGVGTGISAFNDNMIVDPKANGVARVARTYTLNARMPSSVNFYYNDTIFRVEVPIGTSFDAVNPNEQLVPSLCDGAVLRNDGESGPSDGFTETGPVSNGLKNGAPVRWDRFGQALFPVQPGSYKYQWPDQNNPGKKYNIEIVTGYPGDLVRLSSQRERKLANGNSIRETSPGFVTSITLPRVEKDFPGSLESPGSDAHYRHLFDTDPERQAPTKLDLKESDSWKFSDIPYADSGVNAATDPNGEGTPFTVQGPGRSVLVYSYRPNRDEAANGDLSKERLAVRVVRSEEKTPITPNQKEWVLGRKGLSLGGGEKSNDGGYGLVQRSGNPTTDIIDHGDNFIVDFWLNAEGLSDPSDVVLSNCTTDETTLVTCDSTAGIVEGMLISGITVPVGTKVISVPSETTLILSSPAIGSETELTLTASNKPVKLVKIGSDGLKVDIDPSAKTITASYKGLSATHDLPISGAGWHHYTVHLFQDRFFNTVVSVLDFHLDGIRIQKSFPGALLSSNTTFIVSNQITQDGLVIGSGANPADHLNLDQFRIYALSSVDNYSLRAGEIRELRNSRSVNLRKKDAQLRFAFEAAPTNGSFTNDGVVQNVGIGPVESEHGPVFAGKWARLDIQEVATRLTNTLDNANFGGGGYIQNSVSNYNAQIYDREKEVGRWGSIFPVNDGVLYTDVSKQLEVAYYENPSLVDEILHPDVAWPYQGAVYKEIKFPTYGPHKDKAIYIASRVGSEGVDQNGRMQQVFGLDLFDNFAIYNQPSKDAAGYNPNDEHAIAAGSNRAGLKVKGKREDLPNNPPLAAFALQKDINQTTKDSSYTSDPWVLIQVDNLQTGLTEMAAYKVFATRSGVVSFPRPSDYVVNKMPGLTYEDAANPEDRFLLIDRELNHDFSYQFEYQAAAGDTLVPPYPLNLVIGNTVMADANGQSIQRADGINQRALWRDVNGTEWVVSGEGNFFYRFLYPNRGDFYLRNSVPVGTPVAWLPEAEDGSGFTGAGSSLLPRKVIYDTIWKSDYPKLKRGESLTYQGGEYFNENPGSNGLPALVAFKSSGIVYDSATPSMVFGPHKDGQEGINRYTIDQATARITRPLDRHEYPMTVATMKSLGFNPSDTEKIFVVAERWYFKALPGSLQKRFYFNSLAEKLVLRGFLNGKDSGAQDLTDGPDPINTLEPNYLSKDEWSRVNALSSDGNWTVPIKKLEELVQNPNEIVDFDQLYYSVPNGGRIFGGGFKDKDSDYSDKLEKYEGFVEATQALDELLARVEQLELGIASDATVNSEAEDPLNSTGSEVFRDFVLNYPTEEIERLRGRISEPVDSPPIVWVPSESVGVGSALVPNPSLLMKDAKGSHYITIAENNSEELGGAAVSLHIIEIIPDRYRGAIKVIEAADAFSEKISLQHNGEFGGNTDDLYYEWWIRDAADLDTVAEEVNDDGTLKQFDSAGNTLWQEYLPKERSENSDLNISQKHLGLTGIVFEGSPKVTLADKLVLMRYRHKDEKSWKLVPFEITDPVAEWKPGDSEKPGPFQWAGAANSPQLQADGSKRYIPQLVMGWVKRVLDRINPYEARYTDFFGNKSPATYSSQIQIAGAPFAGNVALNSDKNVIENTGLIELYETVLQRAKELSIENTSNPVSSDGINQALLLAATRLSTLYELLAREAYSDAQDSTVSITDGDDLANVASFTHAFQNMEPDLLHEELALLRGSDFRKSFPVYNRLFWNYAKGTGEVAYNLNYNIYDANRDGFVNEDDARVLYPQGHGDSWGHFVNALDKHYALLRQPVFKWQSRAELYSLMQNVLEVDYLDEKTFARLAGAKALAGRDIVRGTYRLAYTQDPDGQWQGYTDGVNPARAWGVSEWAHRAGQAAYFDWIVANSLLPEDAKNLAPEKTRENLHRIERLVAIDEISGIAGGLHEIQMAMDEANQGANPLGFDSEAVNFDLDLEFYENTSGGERYSHFEQIYSRAVAASNNALTTLDFTSKAGNKLLNLAGDTSAITVDAIRQDNDFRNRLIEIFGRPFEGNIGFGKAYPEGYDGPDTQLYAYLAETSIDKLMPPTLNKSSSLVTYESVLGKVTNLADNKTLTGLYADAMGNFFQNIGNMFSAPFGDNLGFGGQELKEAFVQLEGTREYEEFTEVGEKTLVPVRKRSKYAFRAPSEWGKREIYGKLQTILEEDLIERIALDQAIDDYSSFLKEFEAKGNRLNSELIYIQQELDIKVEIAVQTLISTIIQYTLDTASEASDLAGTIALNSGEVAAEFFPTSVGFSIDATAPARGSVKLAAAAIAYPTKAASKISERLRKAAQIALEALNKERGQDIELLGKISGIEDQIVDLVGVTNQEVGLRDAVAIAQRNIALKQQEYLSTLSEGFRLMKSRATFNKSLAASVQRDRYSDMMLRITRNDAMTKYQSAFNNAARYTWLAAKAYDYETSLSEGDPAAVGTFLDRIVKERQLGLWTDGEPSSGQGGLAEILHQLNANFAVLKGQLGITNPQAESEEFSLRRELFRIGNESDSSQERWEDALKARIVPDLNSYPAFVRHCRPFATVGEGAQPGIVIRFSSQIRNGVNFFGNPLAPGDSSYSLANYATKIRGVGVGLENYGEAGLSTTPRAYLVPIGVDYIRTSGTQGPEVRLWDVQEQRIPTPFTINTANLVDPGYIPSLKGIDGTFGQLRRHGDFRIFNYSQSSLEGDGDGGGKIDGELDDPDPEIIKNSRLIGRSVWNSDWLMVIPGANLHADPITGLNQLSETISDIKLEFNTYSHSGR